MLLVLYMCFGSFVLLNGLIGVFGTVFDEVADDRVDKLIEVEPSMEIEDIEPIGRARATMRRTWLFWLNVLASVILGVAEPVVIAQQSWNQRSHTGAQVAILALSTLLYLIQLRITYNLIAADMTVAKTLAGRAAHIFDGEVLFETACLAVGWIFLFESPGVAALRCFRIFRVLWYFESGTTKEIQLFGPAKFCYLLVRSVN